MSKVVIEKILQISVVHLKALLNAVRKVVDIACTFFLGYHFYLLSDGCLQCMNEVRVAVIKVVHEEPPEKKICNEPRVRQSRCPFHFRLWLKRRFPNSLGYMPSGKEDHHLARTSLPPGHVFMFLNLSHELLNQWNVTPFCHPHCVTSNILKEKWSTSARCSYGDPCLVIFKC